MGDWTRIRGWLYHPAWQQYEQVRRIVLERHIERGPYGDVWVLPREPDREWQYTFVGGEARTATLPHFRETARTIAETVFFIDEASRYAVEGYFRWDSDDGRSGEWVCGKGRFVERPIPTSYGWSLEPDPDPDDPGGPAAG